MAPSRSYSATAHSSCLSFRITRSLAVLVGIVLWFPLVLQASGMLEIAELLSHAEHYNKQKVAVVGEVTKVRSAQTKKGQHVYGFLLEDGNSTVKVVGFGKPTVREGEQVMVEGIFRHYGRPTGAPLSTEIKAELIRPLDRLHPDLVG